jgi:hypothetical protein
LVFVCWLVVVVRLSFDTFLSNTRYICLCSLPSLLLSPFFTLCNCCSCVGLLLCCCVVAVACIRFVLLLLSWLIVVVCFCLFLLDSCPISPSLCSAALYCKRLLRFGFRCFGWLLFGCCFACCFVLAILIVKGGIAYLAGSPSPKKSFVCYLGYRYQYVHD